MSIRPVEFGGLLQRADNVSAVKQQEEQKPLVDQSNISFSMSKEAEEKLHQIQDMENATKLKNDTSGQGNSKNFEQEQNKKKKKEKDSVKSKKIVHGGFDIKI